MSTKLDPRVVRTRGLLRDALITLIEQKGYDNISVQDITDEATINRSTFYKHFYDKDELFQYVIIDIVDDLRQISILPKGKIDEKTIQRIFIQLFEHVQAHWDFYTLMLANQSVALFTQQLQVHMQKLIIKIMAANEMQQSRIDPALYASFVSAAILGVTKWWVIEAPDHPPQQLALQFMQLILGGMVDEFNLDKQALFGYE